MSRAHVDYTFSMRTRNQKDWTIELRHVVQQNSSVDDTRGEHRIFFLPEDEVLVPLPHVTAQRRFRVYLELVNVDIAVEQLHRSIHQSRVLRQPLEHLVRPVQAVNGT